jgi:hypothetical protein
MIYRSNAVSGTRRPLLAAGPGVQVATPPLPKGLQAPLSDDIRQYVPNFEVRGVEEEAGADMERLLLRQNYQEYITRNKHGADIPKGALCGVYRTPRGHIRVNIAAKYLVKNVGNLGSLSESEANTVIPYTFEGAWYLKGYENRERIDEIYRMRMSKKYFRGCMAF